jgi:glycerol-3-phosphate dehydrogenase
VAGVECRELFEGAIRTVASAAVWHDYQMLNGDRITLAFAHAAAAHGAVLANYVEAIGPLKNGSELAGVSARDTFTGDTFEIRARILVNAGGPWGATLFDRTGVRTGWPLLKAMNLVTSRPARKAALVAATRAGRALVLLPWNGRTLVGTSESPDTRQPDDQDAKRSEVEAFLADINATFPTLGLKADEITLVHRGIVPAAAAKGRLSLLGQSRIIDHGMKGNLSKLVSIVGVKYTTARIVAERAVDALISKLGRAPVACRTGDTLLPGAGLEQSDPADPIAHAVREEMAFRLCDVVIRRTGLGVAGKPADAIVNDVAGRMQNMLGWSEQRKTQEIDALRRFYDIT